MKKRLTKGSNPVLGGVVSGLADYFDIDPLALRLLFVALMFFNLFFGFVYLACWIIIPNYPGETTPSHDQQKSGLAILIVGVLLLLKNFFPRITFSFIAAIALIALGIYIIVRKK